MKKATLKFNHVQLHPSRIHKLRGYVGNLFKDHDLIHNHDVNTGKQIYRYPLIQFKRIEETPVVIAITDQAIEIFMEIFMTLDEIRIDNAVIPVREKDLQLETANFGFTEETYMYKLVSPWIGLNQTNHLNYVAAGSRTEKATVLKRAMTGNILSMAKGLGCWLEKGQQIKLDLQLKEKPVTLKGKKMIGFSGIFKTNFMIPDHLGIGKSVSRGFGTVKKRI